MGILSVEGSDDGSTKGVAMLDEARSSTFEGGGDYVHFGSAGDAAVGEYHCSNCGYGVTIHTALPPCPMCAGTKWEQVPWSPFTRTGRFQ
jgi:rubredoxin